MEPTIEIKKILVPVDYSGYSIQACRYAFLIASKANAEILLFHAFYSPAYDLIELAGNSTTQKKLREEVTHKLRKKEKAVINIFLKSLAQYPEFKLITNTILKTDVRPGLAKNVIKELSAEYEPGLVILGTRGESNRETMLGHIAENAIKHLPFPVLAITGENSDSNTIKLKRILFLTDYDESDFVSIKKLMGFTHYLNLHIYCLHIGSESGNWERVKMAGLKAYFKSSYNKMKVECDILGKKENSVAAIQQYVTDNKIDIISLTSRKRSILEKYIKPSLTKKLFHSTNTPLLVFHS